jgi:magnesium transporter
MITIYQGAEQQLKPAEAIGPGCWVHLVAATEQDTAALAGWTVPPEFLTHLLDLNERPRAEREGDAVLLILHFPYAQGPAADIPYITIPLSIIVTPDLVLTSVPISTGFLQGFANRNLRGMTPARPTGFVLQILLYLAKQYLESLNTINAQVDRLEDQLQRSLRNQEVLGLLKYEKSLTYFTSALRSNEVVLGKLQRGNLSQWDPEEMELLEDVLIEVRQAIEQVEISQSILAQMMDAFASIVSNNLNSVVKFLTSVTLVVSLPTLIASLYGMNVVLPGGESPLAFLGILAASIVVSLGVLAVLWRRDWL